MRQTKADLEKILENRGEMLNKARLELHDWRTRADIRKRESDSAKDKAKDLEKKLLAGKNAIVQELAVRHERDLCPVIEWTDGQQIEPGGATEAVRFLRHLHEILAR